MRVLWFHESRPHTGEDPVVTSQAVLLRASGVEVSEIQFERNGQASLEAWSGDTYAQVRDLCEHHRPDVAHVHNCWNRISPSVHAACHDAGVATVQSLYDFRLLCVNGMFVRDGKSCVDCLGRDPWKGVTRRCAGSLLASAAAARAIKVNRKRGTWKRDVDAFIVSTESSWEKFVYGGVPASRIFIRPHFTGDPGDPASLPSESDLVLYIGTLSRTADIELLLAAWKSANLSRLGRLVVAGDGPERKKLEEALISHGLSPAAVMFVGQINPVEVLRLIWSARAVVAPSAPGVLSGKVAVKALSCGRPVLCARSAEGAEFIQDGSSGLKFEPGDARGLGQLLEFALSDDTIVDCMGEVARAEYLTKYSSVKNYEILMRVYRSAIERRGGMLPPELLVFEPAQTVI